ncbi:unnamed protein product, partial [Discosporangium mesarthrocarpum]
AARGVDSLDIRPLLKPTDIIRVGQNVEDNEATVAVRESGGVEPASAVLENPWSEEEVRGGRVLRFSLSRRKKPYVDLMVARDKAARGLTTDVHEAGFSSIYKSMAGESVSCPICMCGVVRPTVTLCAHLVCPGSEPLLSG